MPESFLFFLSGNYVLFRSVLSSYKEYQSLFFSEGAVAIITLI